MKYGVIDIGSNSVRLMMSDGTHTLSKILETTQLSEHLALTGVLCQEAMDRTKKVIVEYYNLAIKSGADIVYAFATEAVRSAKNRDVFIESLKNDGVAVEIVPSKNEAIIGFSGAYTGNNIDCSMDIGGASTELAVGDSNGLIYAKSLPIGIVRIKDNCGEDVDKMKTYIRSTIKDYGNVPSFNDILAIGGTASSYAAIVLGLKEFVSSKVDFYKLYRDDVEKTFKRIHAMSYDERLSIPTLSPKRRDVIVGGGVLLVEIMKYLNKDYVVIRESDNLEGFLKYKLKNSNYFALKCR